MVINKINNIIPVGMLYYVILPFNTIYIRKAPGAAPEACFATAGRESEGPATIP
jgi:hypothetical protein